MIIQPSRIPLRIQHQDEVSKAPTVSHKLHRRPGDAGAFNTRPMEDWNTEICVLIV